MKHVTMTLLLECPDDVPSDVLAFMAWNLADHANREFGADYQPAWTTQPYEGPVLAKHVSVSVGIVSDTQDKLSREFDALMRRFPSGDDDPHAA